MREYNLWKMEMGVGVPQSKMLWFSWRKPNPQIWSATTKSVCQLVLTSVDFTPFFVVSIEKPRRLTWIPPIVLGLGRGGFFWKIWPLFVFLLDSLRCNFPWNQQFRTLKWMVRILVSFWGPAYLQGRIGSFREGALSIAGWPRKGLAFLWRWLVFFVVSNRCVSLCCLACKG